jgi:hypothetical protein
MGNTPAVSFNTANIISSTNLQQQWFADAFGTGFWTNPGGSYSVQTKSWRSSRPMSVHSAPTKGVPRKYLDWNRINVFGFVTIEDVRFDRPHYSAFPYTTDWLGDLWREGSFWSNPAEPTWPDCTSNMDNRALSKALDKLKNQQFHAGNFLGERDQTVKLFETTTHRIASDITKFRSKNPFAWKQVKKYQLGGFNPTRWRKIPDAWLELQYGWKPLMSDVFGACNALKQDGVALKPYVKVTGTAKREDKAFEVTRAGQYGSTQSSFHYVQNVSKVVLWYEVENDLLIALSSLGVVNPLEVVWELTRFSFVVDWFLPVGEWLGALTADLGYRFVTGGISHFTKIAHEDSTAVIRTPSGAVVGSPPWVLSQGGNASFGYNGILFSRTAYTSSPIPGLYLKSPFSSGHIANAMALLVQAFK